VKITIKWLLGALVGILSFAVLADVPDNETAVNTGGFGKWIIDALFESGTLTTMPDNPGIIGAVLIPFSLSCMVVAVFVIVIKSIQHLLVVAQSKDVESSPVSMTWAPIHMLVAVALIMPMPSGYSMGQYFGIWLGQQSNTLGNMTSEAAVTTNFGVITQMPLPDVRKASEAIIDAHVCKMVYNAAARYVESAGGAYSEVIPRRMTTRELESVAGLSRDSLSANPSITRSGVLFDRVRGNGGFLTQGSSLGNFCGQIMVEFTTETKNFWDDQGFFGNDPVPATTSNGGSFNPTVPACTTGPMCVMGNDLTAIEGIKESTMAMFNSAHSNAATLFITEAVNGSMASGSAVLLTYDLQDYFDGLLDDQASSDYVRSLDDEEAYIEAAADQTVQMISNMQTSVYASYAAAINTFSAQRNSDTGDSFRDSVQRVGWPILGLHWFQMSTLNQKILEAVNFRSTSTVGLEGKLAQIGILIGDDQLVNRMQQRINRYKSEVHNRLLNTQLDPNPASNGTRAVSNILTDEGIAHMNNATGAADIKSSFPMFAEKLIRSAGDGVITTEDGIMKVIDGYVKSTVFPFLVSPLKNDSNIISGMVNMGHNIIVITEIGYLTKAALDAYAKSKKIEQEEDSGPGIVRKTIDLVSNPFKFIGDIFLIDFMKSFVGILIMDVFNFVAEMWFFVFLLGLFLAFYVPAIIMIQWLIALVTWMIYIIEAVIVIPLWGILFVANMGERAFAPQIAQQGFVHLLSILVYPAFLVIGFIVGLKVVDVASLFLIDFLIIGFLSSTEGFTFGVVSLVAGVGIVAVAAYQIILRVFSLMLELHDRAISWIGNTQSFGEGQTENMSRGSVTAIIGKIEQKKNSGGLGKRG
jgi:conjugal transfer/type IV secretion protein DotA/TraY